MSALGFRTSSSWNRRRSSLTASDAPITTASTISESATASSGHAIRVTAVFHLGRVARNGCSFLCEVKMV